MLGFESTPTGYRATDEQVAWWQSRDTCPSCSAIVEPVAVEPDGLKRYRHDCNGDVEWSAFSPSDTADQIDADERGELHRNRFAAYVPPLCPHEGGHDQ